MQNQNAVTARFSSKQLLPFGFEITAQSLTIISAMQSQKAVTAYFSSEQLLPFGFEITAQSLTIIFAMQSQKAVTAYFSSEQLLPFGFVDHPRLLHWTQVCSYLPAVNSICKWRSHPDCTHYRFSPGHGLHSVTLLAVSIQVSRHTHL